MSKPVEIAKFDISRVDEGTSKSKTLKIPGTKLYTYVNLFFEDDMNFYDSLTFSMTVSVFILKGKKLAERNRISAVVLHSAFDEDFRQTIVAADAVTNGKRVAVEVLCRGKRPLDE